MSANNETIEMIVEAEYVPEIVATAVEELPITLAELLEEDFGDDDEAEFLQGVLEIQEAIENVILSDRPEDFLLPTPDDLPPALLLLEKLDELKGYKFADRTLARMERRIRGENELVRTFVSESDKINNPAYKKCPLCERHFTIRYLGRHIGNEVCKKVSVAHILRPSTNDKKKVSDKIYAACLDLEDLIARSNEYKKNIMGLNKELEEDEYDDEEKPKCDICQVNNLTGAMTLFKGDTAVNYCESCMVEYDREKLMNEYNQLVEKVKKIQTDNHFDIIEGAMKETDEGEDMEEVSIDLFTYDGLKQVIENLKNALEDVEEDNNNKVYVIKTYDYNYKTKTTDYAGLWEDKDGNKEWTDEEEARKQFEYSLDNQGYIAVELVEIDANSEVRENVIEEWEDNIDDYVESETEDEDA